jgi:hypothetical protein
MIGCLIISLAFIAVIVFLEKTLPDGSKSHFHPTWKRNEVAGHLEERASITLAPGLGSFILGRDSLDSVG